jgi:hypothetical protein
MSQSWEYGPQRLRFDPPVIIVEIEGALTVDESAALLAKIGEIELAHRECGLLIFAGARFSVTADARRHLVATSSSDRPAIPVAVMGAGAVARALFTLMINAIRLTTRKNVPVAFFSTEQEARQWLLPLIKSRGALF